VSGSGRCPITFADANRAYSRPSYTLHLSSFLNAKHRVTFAETGPLHGHSWRLEVSLQVLVQEGPAAAPVEFAGLEQLIRGILRPYEGQFLNDLPPFIDIVPSTENIARFLYGAIDESLAETRARVLDVTLWEAPTKGVTMTVPLLASGQASAVLASLRADLSGHGLHRRQGVPFAAPSAAAEVAATAEPPPPGRRWPEPPGGPVRPPASSAPDPPLSRGGRRTRKAAATDPSGEKGSLRLGAIASVLSVMSVVGVVVVAYWPLLSAGPATAYPWGSDTWGHLFKALFLYNAGASGEVYPTFMSWWYNGLEPFRYWSPLSYYLLAGLRYLIGNIFVAGAWLVPLAAAFGGLSWLAFHRRLGWLAATVAGMVWTVWPDHLRVALAEGNLPRAVTTALLPLLFLAFLDSLERRRWPWSGLAFVALLSLTVLSHAMMAAIVCVAFSLLSLVHWWFGGSRFRDVARTFTLSVLGLLVSSWWLLPSLSEGITAIDAGATGRAIAYFPALESFNPLLRLSNPEVFYWGVSTLAVLALVVATWRSRNALARSLFVCALLGIAMTLPQARGLFSVLPGSHLLWPSRFTSLAPLAFLYAAFSWKTRPRSDTAEEASVQPKLAFRRAVTVLVGLLVLVDALGSLGLVHVRAPRANLAEAAGDLVAASPGWRVAVLDLSRLGSEPSFVLSQKGGREQVFGWAWQGASIGPALVLLNTALEQGRYSYVVDRTRQLGATDLLVPDGQVKDALFAAAASAGGYTLTKKYDGLTAYRRMVPPEASLSPYRVLAIGVHAGNASLLFPAIETGDSPFIDDYDTASLSAYSTVFLTGARWRSRSRAEAVVTEYAGLGGSVVVDLTGFPSDVLSKRPTFLGVTGESIQLTDAPTLRAASGEVRLAGWVPDISPWVAVVPQVLDRVTVSFSHFGQPAAVVGEKDVGGRPVRFVGLNLPYHALLTGDPEALRLLGCLLGLEPEATAARASVPLQDYHATPDGYAFTLTVPSEWQGGRVILPFAALDSLALTVDGQATETMTVEHLLGMPAVPGERKIVLRVQAPPLAPVGAFVSGLAALLVVLYVLTQAGRASVKRKEVAG
jgi:uncharacterized membrane protein/6-pyruvoyl-tetrahydropterin synthase